MVVVTVAMIALLGFAALAIDGAFIHHSRGEMQHAADAAALAAMAAIRNGSSTGEAQAQGQQIGQSHRASGENVVMDTGNLERGTWDFSTRQFNPGTGGSGVTAFRASIQRGGGSSWSPLPLFLGGILGVREASVGSEAVAALRRRDIVLVQDVTYSFLNEFPDAIEGDLAMIDQLGGPMALSGDRVGIASFARVMIESLEMTPLDSGFATVRNTISDLFVCNNASAALGCDGTGTADGIRAGIDIFNNSDLGDDAEKVMVLVSDGVPCYNIGGTWQTGLGKAEAVEAANEAWAQEINIFPITLAVNDGATSVCWIPDPEFNESLARGFGVGLTTPDSEELDELLTSILRRMPVRLVD